MVTPVWAPLLNGAVPVWTTIDGSAVAAPARRPSTTDRHATLLTQLRLLIRSTLPVLFVTGLSRQCMGA